MEEAVQMVQKATSQNSRHLNLGDRTKQLAMRKKARETIALSLSKAGTSPPEKRVAVWLAIAEMGSTSRQLAVRTHSCTPAD